MTTQMTSRQRMLAALECRETDYVPCSFMFFSALRGRCDSQEEFVRRQVQMGLDAVAPRVDIGRPFPPQVQVRQWREERAEVPDILHKEYVTPDGTLKTEVLSTEDWPYPNHVPLFDDYLVPRARKFPVEGPEDLAALRHLLVVPEPDDVARFRANAARVEPRTHERGAGGGRGPLRTQGLV